eukprot:GFUD01001966.1.p1 GENE.GFUD01001966.1~~GFUD01001966.1.p1  ORF type:complete len:179 (+),score=17.36 GFUD01001966.1:126-662(+)
MLEMLVNNKDSAAMPLKEVTFTGGTVGATSIYTPSATYAPANAFHEGSVNGWYSGRNANGNGDLALPWYNFPTAFVPGLVSFRPGQNLCSQTGWCGPTKYQYIGTNDDVCNEFSAWRVLCEDLSGNGFEKRISSKYCLVQDHTREPFKCLGVTVLDSSYTGSYSTVAMNGIRMWNKEI